MKIAVNWINDYVKTGISADTLAHKLTMSGLEVEKVEQVAGDTVFEIEVTPNRPDCLNMIGVAREVSAILNKKLNKPNIKPLSSNLSKTKIEIKDKKDCSRYVGIVAEGVKVAAAPKDIQQRLRSVGLRPINNIVDIANFSLMENGQPLHAFDYDKLAGGKIIVRRAKKGEKIVTLDGEERTLDPSILVIADAKKAVAIAGIMGGKDTEVTDKTKRILLEGAHFDSILIRRASRKLGLSSDSSYRFERGVDITKVDDGASRAFALMQEAASLKALQYNDVYTKAKKTKAATVSVSLNNINALLGAKLKQKDVQNILTRLEFKVVTSGKGAFKVSAPSFRGDIKGKVDIVEEVARVIGYDNLPLSLPQVQISNITADKARRVKRQIRQSILSLGFSEIITYAMTNQASLDATKLQKATVVSVMNPLSLDQELMRPSLLPSLLTVIRSNINRGQKDLKLFELGKVYSAKEEKEVLAMIMTGKRQNDWRVMKKDDLDFFDIKGAVSQALIKNRIYNVEYQKEEAPFFEKGQCASLVRGKHKLGLVGKVSKKILKSWDLKQDNVMFAQLEAGVLSDLSTERKFQSLSEFPSVIRDVSLAVKKDTPFEQIKGIAYELGSKLLVDVSFIEEYLGKEIPQGQRGIVFSLTYQSDKKTLTESEVNKIHKNITSAFVERLSASIR